MSEEQLRILKMIEEKKINAEEGARLLNALEQAANAREQAAAQAQGGRWDARNRNWGRATPPIPPLPPIPPIPPIPPSPPMDPFEAAFSWSGKDRQRERERERERRRGRRDTEPLESESRRGEAPRGFHIRVTDSSNSHTMVNVNLPIGLINFGLKLISRYLPEDSDFDPQAIAEAIRQGAVGKIIDIQQGDEGGPGTHVEITVDG